MSESISAEKSPLAQFTNRYSLCKTLRFELKPLGKTLENIKAKGLLQQDKERAKKYQVLKKIIDEYHKSFIETALVNVKLEADDLQSFYAYYTTPKDKRTAKFDDEFKKVKETLRKQIVAAFGAEAVKVQYDHLFKKELVQTDLAAWLENAPEAIRQKFPTGEEVINDFRKFTTYLTGFHENRKNMYDVAEHATALAHRLIHENLPKFIDNLRVFSVIREKYPRLDFSPLETEMSGVLRGKKLDEVFSPDFYNHLLTQSGIDFFNTIIGGWFAQNNSEKIKGLNEYVNLYNQKQADKKSKAPKFKQLFKQILSDRSSTSWLPEEFTDDQSVIDAINKFYLDNLENCDIDQRRVNLLTEIKNLLGDLATFDPQKIHLRNDAGLTDIAQTLFGNWNLFSIALDDYYEAQIDPQFAEKYQKAKSDGVRKKLDKEKESVTKADYVSIAELQTALKNHIDKLDDNSPLRAKYHNDLLVDYFKNYFFIKDENGTLTSNAFDYAITQKYAGLKGFLNTEYANDLRLIQNKDRVQQLKDFLDAVMALLHFIKPLHRDPRANVKNDESFDGAFTPLYEALDRIVPLYNKTRNYLTQKPYRVEKFKLNFENSTLLDGWDVNKEPDNTAVLFRKDGLFYVGIMDTKSKRIFTNPPTPTKSERVYQKMQYKLLPGANKMLPKVFFSKSRVGEFNPSPELLERYEKCTHKKGDNFNLADCHALIDFFKQSIAKHEDWKYFDFHFSLTGTYQDISGFYREVAAGGYKITFADIPESYTNQLVDEGKLYLFQIYSKDFSPHSKGKPNLHTLYWRALFAPGNLQNVVYKLNGQAEIFYREASIPKEKAVTHQANRAIGNKNPLAKKKTSEFAYDIVKDRRFTEDKFHFHVPVMLNFKAEGENFLNSHVHDYLRNNRAVNIIGLDRGERHLLYLTLIDQNGKILKQETLNDITDVQTQFTTPYQQLLDAKEKERDLARKSWDTIETIKELKAGYLSQVVHKIARMMVAHNAIVVLEDLNFGFKRGRFKVEKQVYQKFEKMLIDKLNYLFFKDEQQSEIGGLYRALQLTNKFESFQALGKQSGFLFYVPAWHTSKIDPATGFVDLLKPRYESAEQSRSFLQRFDSIRFNAAADYFEFTFDYKNFPESKTQMPHHRWTVCTVGKERYAYNPQNKSQEQIDVTAELKKLLDNAGIAYAAGDDLRTAICTCDGANSRELLKRVMRYLSITLALRYSNAANGRDFILSPVANSQGAFFNSETASVDLPQNADANGAYHIALKGLRLLQKVNAANGDKIDLSISNADWLAFAQTQTGWIPASAGMTK